jgi:hypothetical protein
MHELVSLGPAAVPSLVKVLDRAPSSHATAYVALALGRIGDQSAAVALRRARVRYQNRSPAGDGGWDRAAQNEIDEAIRRLDVSGPIR